ncbi:MAG TPA: membrane protein insertion efficiency factor YidD [Acidimicrobiales bacterium]|nr:membrane protein insertion efficiency factor YidD [Actinomycetota bacterium]HJL90234.1 membrane protein insertion efficiency factor YidD [Acidimicrobiales bacterium]HJO98264.1 membrane protein insertion efficiency factor YidD [Acidimicrobiales bacterium]
MTAVVESKNAGQSFVSRFLCSLVHVYQRLTDGRPTPCRYLPTCSNYSLDAIEQHGAVRGLWLTVRRLSRCHPWGGHGWDPAPGADGVDSADRGSWRCST